MAPRSRDNLCMRRHRLLFALLLPTIACAASANHFDDADGGDGTNPTLPGNGGKDGGATPPKSDSGSNGPKQDASQAPGQPTLEIVSGDGTTVPEQWPAGDPLRARARDAQGNPVANANVSWKITVGNGLHLHDLVNDVMVTDSDGISSVSFNAFGLANTSAGYEVETVTASWNALTADFHVIIQQVPAGQYAANPLFDIVVPGNIVDLGTVKAGSTTPGAIQMIGQFQQGNAYGQGVPGWGMRLTDPNDTLKPAAVACAGGTAIADSKGNGACDLVAPKTPGDYYFDVFSSGTTKWGSHVKVVQ